MYSIVMNLSEPDIDLRTARELLKGGKAIDGTFAFTNENLRSYIPAFDVRGKEVLTVAASGDHAFNIALGDPKSITCFDLNKMPYYWMELKKAGIITMPFEKFIEVFVDSYLKKDSNFISEKDYNGIRTAMPEKAQKFWDEFAFEIDSKFFRYYMNADGHHTRLSFERANGYLDRKNYETLQGKLEKLDTEFIQSGLHDLPNKLRGRRFDAIFTSNICDHINKSGYVAFVEDELSKIVAPGGFAQVYHRFNTRDTFPNKLLASQTAQGKGLRFVSVEFEGSPLVNEHTDNSVIIMQKD